MCKYIVTKRIKQPVTAREKIMELLKSGHRVHWTHTGAKKRVQKQTILFPTKDDAERVANGLRDCGHIVDRIEYVAEKRA